ncbi:MAG: DUF4884 domain-containing protein [Dysgonomonas sp.]|jgi:hypothetical protein|uniref:DUF4884 domain-containing protein n=1 Tax=Dysgonomonas termitidis TaxID=1516126 RepID=A0ABV9KW66_9BACT|nr:MULTISPECIES: DUF4884 domain-containing protein [unclassified Dysgonomonas]MDR2005210.1 DUF4884 domain-containing protein [Prevotella sp.]HMM02512.1 DUF4884 domain-containing protein [Dysgonomonas sp.]
MKTLFTLFLTGIAIINLSSCYSQRPVASRASDNNQTYKVEYLFEHEGCKVYRFYDRGNYVYFTNCTGDVTAISTDSTKTRVETIVKSNLLK